jgi:SOS-response transcriptional repressor LexA
VYQVTDDSLAPLGVLDGDLVYVRPLADVQQAAGRFVVCNLRGEAFAKVLEPDGRRLRLVSPSQR